MTDRQPSVVFDTITELYEVLKAGTWPPLVGANLDVLNADVLVSFGELGAQPPRESVAVTGSVDDDDQSGWPELGQHTKRETFSTDLVVTTNVPGRTSFEAWARLKVLVQTIDGLLRDMTNGRPLIPTTIAALGVLSWSVTSVETFCWPTSEGGFFASAVVTVGVKAHI